MQAQPGTPDRPCAACQGRLVDRLTGVADRWGWDIQAPRLLCDAQRRNESLALLILDLDNFKGINDRWGHPAGDVVLASVADVLRRDVRCSGLVGRYGGHGGDEFLILLPQTDSAQATRVAERLRDGIRKLTLTVTATSGERVLLAGITASIGLTACVATTDTAIEHLVRSADAALQQAKRQGRDRVRVADTASVPTHAANAQDVSQRTTEDIGAYALDHQSHLRHLLHLAHVMSGSWNPHVLLALSARPRRWGDLMSTIRNASALDERQGSARRLHGSILSRTLRRLERTGLVHRVREPGFPRSTRYELSPAGHELISALAPGVRWSHQHQHLISTIHENLHNTN